MMNTSGVTIKKQSSRDMTEGPIFLKLFKFALPIIATGLLQMLYNASDMIIVGNFSPNGSFSMGAVGSCTSLISLIVNTFIGLSVGVGICVSQAMGAKRYDDVDKFTHSSFIASIYCGIAVGIFGFFMAGPLLTLMGTPSDVYAEAVPYMQAYFVGVPAALVYNFLAAVLRSTGDSKRPLIFLSVSGLLNVISNMIFVLVFGMGAIGVGIATTISQYASMAMIIVYMMRVDGACRLELKKLKFSKIHIQRVLQNGLPAGLQSIVFSISNVLIQSSVNGYGAVVVTGNAAAANIEGFIYIAMNSMYQATLTFVGQNMGAGKVERIKRVSFVSLATVVGIGIALGGLAYLFHDPLLSIYEPGMAAENIAVREAGAIRMSIISTTYCLCGLMDVLGGILRGMGRPVAPMVNAIFGSCVLRIVWVYAVGALFPGHLLLLYVAYPVTWVITSIAHSVCCVKAYGDIKKAQIAGNISA